MLDIKTWLDRMNNFQQFLLQGGAIAFSWILTALICWAGWTILQTQIDDLRWDLKEARNERAVEHHMMFQALNELKDALKK